MKKFATKFDRNFATKFDRNKESGFTTAWILGLVLILILIGGVFFEFGSILVDHQNFSSTADRAANAGATALNEDLLISSDGTTIELYDRNSSPAPTSESAQERCESVIQRESSKPGSKIAAPPTSFCVLDPTRKLIEAHISGTVDLGILSTVLGVPDKTFLVVSKATPSCSDNSSSSGGC